MVFDWLNTSLELPIFANAYKGAWQLLEDKTPGYITFVAHTGRDLMNILVPTVEGIEHPQVQYHQLLDKLQNVWNDEWGGPNLVGQEHPVSEQSISYIACQLVRRLIDEHRAGRERNKRAAVGFFSAFLDYADSSSIPETFVSEWNSSREWLRKHAHLREPAFADDAPSEVEKHFRILDGFLYVAATREFDRLKAINEILEETNE